jgi:hypothetical protein
MGNDIFHHVFTELLSPQINDLSQTTPEYRDYLHQLYFSFKTEITKNINCSDNLVSTLQYLNDLLLCFKTLEKMLRHKPTDLLSTQSSKKTVQDHGIKIIIYLIKKKIHIVKYLIKNWQILNNSLNQTCTNQPNRLSWLISDTALLELSVALARSKAVGDVCGKEVSPKVIAEELSRMFGMKLGYIESKLSKAKNRKKDSSPFLTQLKNSFEIYSLSNL